MNVEELNNNWIKIKNKVKNQIKTLELKHIETNYSKIIKLSDDILNEIKFNGDIINGLSPSNSRIDLELIDNFCQINYIKGKSFECINNYEEAMLCYEKSSNLNHGPSLLSLGRIYDENISYHDYGLAFEYYQKATYGNYKNSNSEISQSCEAKIRYADMLCEKEFFNNAKEVYKKALELSISLDDEFNNEYIENKIKEIEQADSMEIKDDKILNRYFEKTKKHLTKNQRILLMSSSISEDFLDAIKDREYYKNKPLDYSGAIMPTLKLLENVLFETIGKPFFDYCKENIDWKDAPYAFLNKNNKAYVRDLNHMELGSFVKVILIDGYEIVRPSFKTFISSVYKVEMTDKDYIDIATQLDGIRKRWRNKAAHKDIVYWDEASACIKYLIEPTHKFINTFIEKFYND